MELHNEEEMQDYNEEQSSMVSRWIIIVTGILVLAGIGVSSFLFYEHMTGSQNLSCSGTGVVNCLKVTTSAQSYFLGIPVSLLGLGYFIACAAFYNPLAWRSRRRWVAVGRLALAVSGMGFVLWLLTAELVIIGNICLWCTAVHIITFLLFVLTLANWSRRHSNYSQF